MYIHTYTYIYIYVYNKPYRKTGATPGLSRYSFTDPAAATPEASTAADLKPLNP